MPLLRVRDLRTGDTREFQQTVVRIGRDPASELAVAGEGAGFASVAHARVVFENSRWVLEDLGSRNGTYLDERRLAAGSKQAIAGGAVIGLGQKGPRYRVEVAAGEQLEETLAEVPRPASLPAAAEPWAPTLKMGPAASPPPAPPAPPPQTPPPGARRPEPAGTTPRADAPASAPQAPAPSLRLVLRETSSDQRFDAAGTRIRLGRGRECEVQPSAVRGTTVSRVHAEIVLKPGGLAVVRDARSRNGTLLNGVEVTGERPLKVGDHVVLGPGGPDLEILQLQVTLPERQAAAKQATPGKARRSFGGLGRTVFVREMMDESSRRAAARIRAAVWSFVVLLAAAVGGLWWYADRRVRQSEAALAAQQDEARRRQDVVTDSLRRLANAEYDRLRRELDSARTGSAPAAVVESLRLALVEARERTAAVETALQRAQAQLSAQLASGDSLRRQADAELRRLRAELGQASASQVSGELLDSLRAALAAAEQRAGTIEGQLRAVRGVNLAALAQANQGAVGLVSVFTAGEIYDGSGFVITRSGYFVTNRHVVAPDGRGPDSVFVTMADERYMTRSTVVSVPPVDGVDLAVLKIPGYKGPVVSRVDWAGTGARQGEPAALIGFPAGAAAALDETRTVRTSMAAGIFSKVTVELIQFDGFTIGGSSGSPVFNANGDVVAVHRAGLREAAGLGFAIPIKAVISLLPPDARGELGLR